MMGKKIMSEKARNLLAIAMLLSGMSGGEYVGVDLGNGDDWTSIVETHGGHDDGISNQADRQRHCDSKVDTAGLGCGNQG